MSLPRLDRMYINETLGNMIDECYNLKLYEIVNKYHGALYGYMVTDENNMQLARIQFNNLKTWLDVNKNYWYLFHNHFSFVPIA